jgi:hypothetical protein
MGKILAIATLALMLAACQQGQSGGLGSMFGGSSYQGASSAEGCGSGERADVLHQNRPGGSDYSAIRCGVKGY